MAGQNTGDPSGGSITACSWYQWLLEENQRLKTAIEATEEKSPWLERKDEGSEDMECSKSPKDSLDNVKNPCGYFCFSFYMYFYNLFLKGLFQMKIAAAAAP